jgi:hypothetical protein
MCFDSRTILAHTSKILLRLSLHHLYGKGEVGNSSLSENMVHEREGHLAIAQC